MNRVLRSIPCAPGRALLLAVVLGGTLEGGLIRAAPVDDNGPAYAIVDNQLVVQGTRIIEIREDAVIHIDDTGEVTPLDMSECVALVKTAGVEPQEQPAHGHVLYLADGQRLPGAMPSDAAGQVDHIAWSHPWLGYFEISLENVRAVTFHRDAPMPSAGRGDAVVLANGDRIEGFVVDIGNDIEIQLEGAEDGNIVSIPRERVASIALNAGDREPTGRRLWFEDGTTLDAGYLVAGPDSYLRLRPVWAPPHQAPIDVRLADVSAIVFDPQRLVPLSTLPPAAVSASTPRFQVPAPEARTTNAVLGARPIEFRGPLIVRYVLPDGASRFAGKAIIPTESRGWANFQLAIRVDDQEVYREAFDQGHPEREINLELRGSELTIEMLIGERGPVHDRLVLEGALLLVE